MFLFIHVSNSSPGSTDELSAQIINQKIKQEIYVEAVKTKMKDYLIEEVKNYICDMAPNTKLNSEFIVTKCLEYNTDIIFVLSQALLESHFGTKGKAAKTNSVWNVGTYDDGQILYTYSDPNESLEPYLRLINEKYLINITTKGDTIYKDLGHLVQDRGYKNYQGARFASARGYENGMRKLMVSINQQTSISFYQNICALPDNKILTYFRPEISNIYNLYALN